MGIRWERKACLVKSETVYGTDSVPTGAANALLLKNVTINPLEGEAVPREIIRAGFGSMLGFFVGRHVSLNARVDLAGAGAAGTVPAFGALLRACGVAETVSAAVKVDYTPAHSGFESVSMYFNHESARHIAVGGRGNAKLRFQKRRPPEIEVSMLARWQSDTSVALPALTTTAWKDPQPSTMANTPTFTVDGLAVAGSSFELDLGMQPAYRDLLNKEEIIVRDRKPKITMLIEETPIATKNFFGMVGGAPVPLAYVHGIGAGNIVDIAVPKIQITGVQRQEEDTESMLSITADVILDAPELTISIK